MITKRLVIAGLTSLLFVAAITATALVPASSAVFWRLALGSGPAHARNTAPVIVPQWVAAAPGRVEPASGLIQLGTRIDGRVDKVAVKQNDRVEKGDLLVQLGDQEVRARLRAAEAEAAASRHERDAHPLTPGRESVTKAEDAAFDAQRAADRARLRLDDAIASSRERADAGRPLSAARRQLADALVRLRLEKASLAALRAKGDVPAPNVLEAKVIDDRSKVAEAQAEFDEARIRAPLAGTVLEVNARVGDVVTPAAGSPLVIMADMSKMRVRAEVDERDVAKIKPGQSAVVRCNAYPGKDFNGKVAEIAPILAIPTEGLRHAHQAANVGVMSVLIDLDGSVPLLPGMRTDVLFRPNSEPAKAAPPVT